VVKHADRIQRIFPGKKVLPPRLQSSCLLPIEVTLRCVPLALSLFPLVHLDVPVIVSLHLLDQGVSGILLLRHALTREPVLPVDDVELLLDHAELVLLAAVVVTALLETRFLVTQDMGLVIDALLDRPDARTSASGIFQVVEFCSKLHSVSVYVG